MSLNYRASWVPEQEHRDWEKAASLGVAHIDRECTREGAAALLVTATVSGADYTPSLRRLVARYGHHTTLGSRSRRAHSGQRPTLVYVPDCEMLEQAAGYARGHALCAIESRLFRLDGWAAATGALDLDSGEIAVPPPDDLLHHLEHLVFVGNNGWADQYGKRDAGRILPDLRSLSADYVAGYVIGKGRSADGAKRLHAMLKKATV
jgi:hypothetical protein